jgi:hypothetical protein
MVGRQASKIGVGLCWRCREEERATKHREKGEERATYVLEYSSNWQLLTLGWTDNTYARYNYLRTRQKRISKIGVGLRWRCREEERAY